jgi:hypothetical protein
MSSLSLWDLPTALENWHPLKEEATWSRAVYAYGWAVTSMEVGWEEGEFRDYLRQFLLMLICEILFCRREKGE